MIQTRYCRLNMHVSAGDNQWKGECQNFTIFSKCIFFQSKALDSTMLENVHSFTRGDHQSKKKLSKAKKQSRVGHSFVLTFYRTFCVCDVCGRVLWGVGYQGYQCTGKWLQQLIRRWKVDGSGFTLVFLDQRDETRRDAWQSIIFLLVISSC